MSKGLEALKELKSQQQGVNVYANDYLGIIEKELKALEIIRYKNVSIECLKRAIKKEGLEWYNSLCPYQLERLTQDEYDLLKEMLLWV